MFSLRFLTRMVYRFFAPAKYLRETYQAFRKLLEYDHQSHEMLSWLERLYHERKGVDFYAAIRGYNRLSYAVSKMVELLDTMAPRSSRKLLPIYCKTDSSIRASALSFEEPDPSSPYVLPLDQMAKGSENLAGSKATRLGRIGSELHLPVPRGFAITTSAFHGFCEANQIKPKIEAALADLDADSPSSLEKTSTRLTSLVLDGFLPPELREAISDASARLTSDDGSPGAVTRWAARSSAVGEDSALSFAGQFKTVLNVDPRNFDRAYKEVIASKYSPNALLYRVKSGFLDQETPMAVLVLEMIDPEASGVVYSRSPVTSGPPTTTVYAVWGLGEHLVKGATAPDAIEVSREQGSAARVIRKEPGTRETKMVASKDGRVQTVPLETHEKTGFCLDDGTAIQLADWVGQLESHFGPPQDVEWCRDRRGRLYILQSRPLGLEPPMHASCEIDPAKIPNPILLSGGERAASGMGSGTVFLAHSADDIKEIPKRSVLVAHTTGPSWAQAMDRLSAVVTDLGSVAGHFASIAREWRVPTLVNTGVATQRLQPGETVTVDADRATVFAGTVQGLPDSACEKQELSLDSPFMRRLRLILDHASPLHLLNPQDPDFLPEHCKTLHDVVRFVHEKAVQEMFSLGGKSMSRVRGARKLISEIPVTLYVLDLGGGTRNDRGSKEEVHLKDVQNLGLQALWKGLSHRDIGWSPDVIHFNWEEFDRLSAGIISLDSQLLASFAVISQDYLNINIRFGYHFVVIDSLFTSRPEDNFITLRFKGGGGTPEKRHLRVRFMALVLRAHGFETVFEGDTLDVTQRGRPLVEIQRKMEMLGFLLGFTRLLDMRLEDGRSVDGFSREFLTTFPPEQGEELEPSRL